MTTAAFPTGLDSFEMGRALERDGFWVSYKSSYLRRENWMQICLMSEFHRNQMMSLVERLEEFCAARRAA